MVDELDSEVSINLLDSVLDNAGGVCSIVYHTEFSIFTWKVSTDFVFLQSTTDIAR